LPEIPPESGATNRWTRADTRALILCAAVGILISALPHLIWWAKTGEPVWLADNDDLVSLAASANAYHNHPLYMSDLLRESGGDTIFPGLQYIPFVLAAKVLSLNPILINLLWRLWAGAALSITTFLLLHCFIQRPWVVAGLTLALICNAGLLTAHIFDRQLIVLFDILSGRGQQLVEFNPQIFPHWRVLMPAAGLPFVFAFLVFQIRARANPTKIQIALAAVAFGVLFYLYFYFWIAVGLSLLLVTLLDAGHRRTHLSIAILGTVLGLPSIISNYLTARNNPGDWGPRNDFFLPIPRMSEFLLPKLAVIMLAITFVWIWRNRRTLLPLWTLTASALLLANHQVITGLQIQNFHWSYIWGPLLSVVVVLCVILELEKHIRLWRVAVAGVLAGCMFMVSSGFWLRSVEATRTGQSVEFTTAFARYREQRMAEAAIKLVPRAVIAGDQRFVDFAAIVENVRPLKHYMALQTPAVTDAELDARYALNALLLGQSRPEYEREQTTHFELEPFGPISRDHTQLVPRVARQMAAYDTAVADPAAALDRFAVRYVALPAGRSPSPIFMAGEWKLLESGPAWQIWERTGKISG
jgi:hypothetical protein